MLTTQTTNPYHSNVKFKSEEITNTQKTHYANNEKLEENENKAKGRK